MQPLTHHQILDLAAPFTRAGRQVDLAASARLARRLAFRPVQHAAVDGAHPALTEILQLDASDPWRLQLCRVLTAPDGLDATLDADGPDAAALLARLAAVPLQRQWRLGAGWQMALSHRVTGSPQAPADGLQLNRAAVQLPGFRLRWTAPPVHSRLGDLRLAAAGGPDSLPQGLPEDLLAVLGYAWTRLLRQDGAWAAYLRQSGTGLAAYAQAEQRLVQTAEHLARTLAAPPALVPCPPPLGALACHPAARHAGRHLPGAGGGCRGAAADQPGARVGDGHGDPEFAAAAADRLLLPA